MKFAFFLFIPALLLIAVIPLHGQTGNHLLQHKEDAVPVPVPVPSPHDTPGKNISRLQGDIILAALILSALGWAIYFSPSKRNKREAAAAAVANLSSAAAVPFTKRDYLLSAVLTLCYAAVACMHMGSFRSPQTSWQPSENSENAVLDLGETRTIERIGYFFSLGKGSYTFHFSETGETWQQQRLIEQSSIFDKLEWRFLVLKNCQPVRFIKISPATTGVRLNEVAFFAPGQRLPLPVAAVTSSAIPSPQTLGKAENLVDEQDTAVYFPDHTTGMYFDEVYHARTAYEHVLGIEPTETTHPPLGKLMIAAGIAIFGMNPGGYRIVGILLGILMIPLMYRFALTVFKKTRYALITALLMTLDFMHFTQTRIATIDVFGVFFIILMFYFMYRYYTINFYLTGLIKSLFFLFMSGLCFGLGVAAKWITLYGGVGLAVILFTSLAQRCREFRQARYLLDSAAKKTSGSSATGELSGTTQTAAAIDESLLTRCRHIVTVFPRFTAATLSWCVLFFIFIPLIIYIISYIPILKSVKSGTGHGLGLRYVLDQQVYMFNYHSQVKDRHPFSSTWWEWPVIKRPVWYYRGEHGIPGGKIASIAAMGNPAIWWLGLAAVPWAYILALKKRDGILFAVLVAFACQYLTWAIVPRHCTFIYHYFAAVPFVILCITAVMHHIEEKKAKSKKVINMYLVFTGLLFVMFYPILSGMVVSKAYVVTFLKWFKTWIFFS